jgi:hypothetical protein
MRLFDAYIFVDWSGASKPTPKKPSADSIWCGELFHALRQPLATYHRTRQAAIDWLGERLRWYVERRLRVLVGYDFPLGYPVGFARALGVDAEFVPWEGTWRLLADRIRDEANNANNRFEVAAALNVMVGGADQGPFWGCTKAAEGPCLSTRRPVFPFDWGSRRPLPARRTCEDRLPGTQEAWKLMYVGSVGSQALLGIPRVRQLLEHPKLRACSRVWPFQTGFTADPSQRHGPWLLHAEVWPGIVGGAVKEAIDAGEEAVKDRAQVRALCRWARDLDASGELAPHFAFPSGLSLDALNACEEEEGWILGAP